MPKLYYHVYCSPSVARLIHLHFFILIAIRTILILHYHLRLGLLWDLFTSGFPDSFYVRFSYLLCVLHAMLYYYYYYYYYYCYYYTAVVTLVKKGNVHPITYREGTEGECRYSCTLSLTSVLDGVGGQRHASAALPRDKTRYPFSWRLGGPPNRSARARIISPSTGIRSKDCIQRSESLYRLSYRGPLTG
jgi:hypothetical protein